MFVALLSCLLIWPLMIRTNPFLRQVTAALLLLLARSVWTTCFLQAIQYGAGRARWNIAAPCTMTSLATRSPQALSSNTASILSLLMQAMVLILTTPRQEHPACEAGRWRARLWMAWSCFPPIVRLRKSHQQPALRLLCAPQLRRLLLDAPPSPPLMVSYDILTLRVAVSKRSDRRATRPST